MHAIYLRVGHNFMYFDMRRESDFGRSQSVHESRVIVVGLMHIFPNLFINRVVVVEEFVDICHVSLMHQQFVKSIPCIVVGCKLCVKVATCGSSQVARDSD